MRVLVVNITAVALTFEAAGRVHATAVGAHGRHQSALIDLFGVIRNWIHNLTRHQSAENLVFTCKRSSLIPFIMNRLIVRILTCSLAGAFLTEATPCGSHGAAAQHLCLRLHHGIKALSGVISKVAGLLSHVDTLL